MKELQKTVLWLLSRILPFRFPYESMRTPSVFSYIFLIPLWLSAQTQDTTVVVDYISYQGNKITKQHIVEREMTIAKGDTMPISAFRTHLQKCHQNLMNTSLFNFVNIDTVLGARFNGLYYYMVNVRMQERWYIWPAPILELAERNFNTWWESKDFSLLNYGLFLNWDNFRGRKEKISLLLQFGYDQKWGVYYHIPYLNKQQTLGVTMSYAHKKQHAISYITQNNKPIRAKLKHSYIAKENTAEISLHYRPDIHIIQHFNMGYKEHYFHDTLSQINPYFSDDATVKYFYLSYIFKSDYRNYKTYPLQGYYYAINVEQKGLGLFKDKGHINQLSVQIDARKYWQLRPRWYAAAFFAGRMGTQTRQHYFIGTGLGYRPYFVRGYEYYVIDGLNFALTKTELRFALFKQRVTTVPLVSNPKFNKIPWAVYTSAFIDSGFVPGKVGNGNTLVNDFLLGGGIGLNVVTYYDLVFRAELSTNKMGETGVFFHFIAPL